MPPVTTLHHAERLGEVRGVPVCRGRWRVVDLVQAQLEEYTVKCCHMYETNFPGVTVRGGEILVGILDELVD